MAKVEVVVKEDKKPKWEPFVTVTLSKREAAGIAALLGKATSGIATYELYQDLDRALGNTNDYGESIGVSGSNIQSTLLDNRFGKL